MSPVQKVKDAVSHLKPEELAQFRHWFDEFDSKIWDKQFEEDVRAGRIDKVAERAVAEFKKGKFKEI